MKLDCRCCLFLDCPKTFLKNAFFSLIIRLQPQFLQYLQKHFNYFSVKFIKIVCLILPDML